LNYKHNEVNVHKDIYMGIDIFMYINFEGGRGVRKKYISTVNKAAIIKIDTSVSN